MMKGNGGMMRKRPKKKTNPNSFWRKLFGMYGYGLPHQSPRECARRVAQGLAGKDYRVEQARKRVRDGYAVAYKGWRELEAYRT